MIGALIRFLNPFGGIVDRLADAYEAREKARNDRERIKADITIQQLEARQRALTEGQGAWVSKAVQAAWAAPFIIYTWKLIVWDKVLKMGATDPLGPFETQTAQIIIGFYFLAVTGRGLISAFRR